MWKNKWQIFSAILVLLGVCVAAYPFWNEGRQQKTQEKLLSQWEAMEDKGEKTDSLSVEMTRNMTEEQQVSGNGLQVSSVEGYDIVGVLTIASIDLKQPIIKEASKGHLAVSICTMEPTTAPGQIGNFVVAGHNSRKYGRSFNRLNEVAVGDLIEVSTQAGESFSYQVTNIQIIEPEDTWILDSSEAESKITLITCYYAQDGTTKRLAVTGKLFLPDA